MPVTGIMREGESLKLLSVSKIISGGQTGADRAGLDFAIEAGIPHGGWCPKYRRAEDGTVPMKYQLQEAIKPGYPYRTKLNVKDSDGTIIFTKTPPGPGSAMTIQACLDFGRPYLVLPVLDVAMEASIAELLRFLRVRKIGVLNVAGSRGLQMYEAALVVLRLAASQEAEKNPENPKRFLRETKVGIGLPKIEGTYQEIAFKDGQDRDCHISCKGAETVTLFVADDGRMTLTPGQAKRLANTLERWATAGDFGNA